MGAGRLLHPYGVEIVGAVVHEFRLGCADAPLVATAFHPLRGENGFSLSPFSG